jgi:hypothetical protein
MSVLKRVVCYYIVSYIIVSGDGKSMNLDFVGQSASDAAPLEPTLTYRKWYFTFTKTDNTIQK